MSIIYLPTGDTVTAPILEARHETTQAYRTMLNFHHHHHRFRMIDLGRIHFIATSFPLLTRQRIPPQEPVLNRDRLARCPYYPSTTHAQCDSSSHDHSSLSNSHSHQPCVPHAYITSPTCRPSETEIRAADNKGNLRPSEQALSSNLLLSFDPIKICGNFELAVELR